MKEIFQLMTIGQTRKKQPQNSFGFDWIAYIKNHDLYLVSIWNWNNSIAHQTTFEMDIKKKWLNDIE